MPSNLQPLPLNPFFLGTTTSISVSLNSPTTTAQFLHITSGTAEDAIESAVEGTPDTTNNVGYNPVNREADFLRSVSPISRAGSFDEIDGNLTIAGDDNILIFEENNEDSDEEHTLFQPLAFILEEISHNTNSANGEELTTLGHLAPSPTSIDGEAE